MMDSKMPQFAEGDILYARDMQTLSDTLTGLTNSPRGGLQNSISIAGMRFVSGVRTTQYDIPFQNNSGEEIPPYAVMRHLGFESTSRMALVTKPNIFGSQFMHLINGPEPVASGTWGMATNQFPSPVLFDDGDGAPVFGELWGPRSGSWKLRKNTGGFQIVGVPVSGADIFGDESIVTVHRNPFVWFEGITDGAISMGEGSGGTVSIYIQGVDSGVDMSNVICRYASVGASKEVHCVWRYDVGGANWQITAAKC